MQKKIALITGATSGIGEAAAVLLAENNFNLILCGRRKEKLDSLQKQLSEKTEVITLQFDVVDKAAVKSSIQSLPTAWRQIDVLINSAGNAHGLSTIQAGNVDDWDAMIDGNVKGLLYVCREILPDMVERQSGHIINIGSIAGKEVYPNGNVYCASKFAVDAITRGMRIDLNTANVKVTSINPGMVETGFSMVRFKGDAERSAQVYKGLEPLKAMDIADIILFTVTRPSHVMVADITVFPAAQASSMHVNRKP
jgi:3-hydroxy acid dehydrogenase / malonic semialdehyde reductase